MYKPTAGLERLHLKQHSKLHTSERQSPLNSSKQYTNMNYKIYSTRPLTEKRFPTKF